MVRTSRGPVARLPGGTYPIRVSAGDVLRLTAMKLEWLGPAVQALVCWGLKRGGFNFNNGDGLLEQKWGYAQILFPDVAVWTTVERTLVDPGLGHLTITPTMPAGLFDTFVWLSSGNIMTATQESTFLKRDQSIWNSLLGRQSDGLIDADAGVVEIVNLFRDQAASNLQVAYGKVG